MLSNPLTEADDAMLPGDDVTLVTRCPVCGSDSLEPAAIGGDYANGHEGALFLVTRCSACECRYANPPTSRAAHAMAPAGRVPDAVLRRWTAPHGADAHVVEVGMTHAHRDALEHAGGGQWTVTTLTVPELDNHNEAHDFVLVNHGLEQAARPAHALRSIATRLRPGGRVALVLYNVRSPSFSLFGGRHWAGYGDPTVRQTLSLRTIDHLCTSTGLRIAAATSLPEPAVWHASLQHLVADWELPGRSLADLMAGPLEAVAQRLRRGAVLAVLLEQERS